MIHFSRDEDYIVILVNKLAVEYKKRLVPLSEIAREYKISLYYLRNLANKLVHKGIIRAVEGKKGGYYLQKNPKLLTMGELMQAIATKSQMKCCNNWENKNECARGHAFCNTISEWRQLNEKFLQKITKLTVTEFMLYNKKNYASS